MVSSSCLAANLASLSRFEEFPVGIFVKAVQLSVFGFIREFTNLFEGFPIALCL